MFPKVGRWFFVGLLGLSPLGKYLQAYPSFVAYGYNNCLTCHFNPYGNGPLNDYGRALSATTISGRVPYLNVSDEKLGEYSGVIGRPEYLGDHVRPAFDFRRLQLVSQVGKDNRVKYYQMQADANVVLKFFDDKVYSSVTVGYTPRSRSVPTQGTTISREHYVGVRTNDNWGIYAGFSDVVYGIRVPDHTAFSRMATGLAQNDQVHGVFTHFTNETWEGGVHVFGGNLYQSPDLRQQGVSGILERDISKRLRIGVSGLKSSNSYRDRGIGAVHARVQFKEGQGLLFEHGYIHERTQIPASTFSTYVFMQSLHRIFRGFHLMGNFEYYTQKAFSPHARFYRWGPSIQWFLVQRIELRSDLIHTRKVDSRLGDTKTWTLASQLHLSF